jgi:hypothetical protein
MEKQALKIYTRPLYLRFRAELRKVTSCNANQVDGHLFEVVPICGFVYGYRKRTYRVEANSHEGIYTCECSKILRDGLLCCHAMRVMAQLGKVDSIPNHYILPRWTMAEHDIKIVKMELPDMPTERKLSNKERKILHSGTLCNNWTEHAKIAAESEKGTTLADKYMRALANELQAMKISTSAKRKEKKQQENTQVDTDGCETGGDAGQGSSA